MKPLRITMVGSRYFGATVFSMLVQQGVDIVQVIVPAEDDRLGAAAKAAGIAVKVLDDPRIVPGADIADDTDLIVAAHSHARVSSEALARARLGGIGYHPSLLPRHRGIAAVEWTIRCGDPIAGGTIYQAELSTISLVGAATQTVTGTSVNAMFTGLTPNSKIRSGVINAPPPTPVMPTSMPTTKPDNE